MTDSSLTLDNIFSVNAAIIVGIIIFLTIGSLGEDYVLYESLIFHIQFTVSQTVALTVIPFAVSSWILILMKFFGKRIENNTKLTQYLKGIAFINTGFGFGYLIFWVFLVAFVPISSSG